MGEREEEGRGRDEKTRTLPTKAGGCRSRRSSGGGAAEGDEGDSPFPPFSEALSTSRLVLLLLFSSGREGSNSTSKSEAEGRGRDGEEESPPPPSLPPPQEEAETSSSVAASASVVGRNGEEVPCSIPRA